MIRCEHDTSHRHIKVTFHIPPEVVAPPVSVVGDFNGWDPAAAPLVRRRQTLRASVVLDAGRRYAFRCLADMRADSPVRRAGGLLGAMAVINGKPWRLTERTR